jgi:hypothetical protein
MAEWNISFGVVIDCVSSFKEENRRSQKNTHTHTHTHIHTHRGNNTPVLVKTVRVLDVHGTVHRDIFL